MTDVQPFLKLKVKNDLPEEGVRVDPIRFRRILSNLVQNAVKFTPEKGWIGVRAWREEPEGEELPVYLFRVEDNGAGMSEEFMGRLFQSFEREGSATETGKSGAKVGKVEFTQSEDRSATAGGASTVAAFGNGMIELWETLAVFLAIMSILGTLVVAVLAEWLFRRQTAGAAEMIRTRTGATIGSGIIGALVAPLAVILLIVFGITLPVAGGVAFTLFAMTSVATGFVGASLFKLAFKKLGRFQCALAGGAIMGVASAIPFLGSIVGALSFMYLLGYVLQSIYLGMREPAPGSAPTIAAE